MAKKHLKRGLTSCISKEVQIKTMRFYYTLIRMLKSKTLTPPNASEGVEQLLVRKQNGTASLKYNFIVLYKTKYTLTIQSSNHSR